MVIRLICLDLGILPSTACVVKFDFFDVMLMWSLLPLVIIGIGALRGRAVQVDPMKPMLKAPGTKRLYLKYDKLVSTFAFKFNLRRYTASPFLSSSSLPRRCGGNRGMAVQVDPIKPVLKAPRTKRMKLK